jgi:hypothetical protein
MNEVPSFLYSPLDYQTQLLTNELESLGGGDSKANYMEAHYVLDDRLTRGDNQTVWLNRNHVSLRDAFMPLNSPISDNIMNFEVTDTYKLQDVLECPDQLQHIKYGV